MKRHIHFMSKLLHKHIRVCLSRTFYDGSDAEEEKQRVALARYAQCWEEDEVDTLLQRSEVTALDRVEPAWSSLEDYFALNASKSNERVLRGSRGRLKSGPVHIITAELVARLNPPEFKTKVATALDMKRCWKERPDIVYSVAHETTEASAAVEQPDKLRYDQSRPKGAVSRVGRAKEEKGAVVGRVGQGSSACSGDSQSRGSCCNWGQEGHMQDDRLHGQAEVGAL